MSPSDFEWLRSSYCATGACVEVRRAGAVVLVQDSKVPASGGGEMQAWSLPEWSGLLAAVKAKAAHPAVDLLPTGTVWLGFQHTGRHEILGFTPDEWSAFVAGVVAGEFDIDKLSGPATHGCGAGQAGAPTSDGAGRAATGAGGFPAAPASVAAEVLGPSPVKPCPMSGASSGHDAGLLTDGESVLPGAAHTHFSGPNVASMNVPAGQPSPVLHQVTPTPQAGQPGLDDGCQCRGCCNCGPTDVPAGRDPSGASTSPGSADAIATTGQPGPGINYALLTELSTKPHPLLNIADDFEKQIRETPMSWTGEVFQEARNAHHLLDMVDIPHGKGYAQDLDSRTYLAIRTIMDLRERLGRLAGWHARESGPSGTVGDYCTECGTRWPCDTRKLAEGTWSDDAEEPQWGSGPLVHHVDEPVDCNCMLCHSLRTESSRGGGTAEATGGAPPDRVGVSGGKAGPGLTPVSPGPAEPTGGVS